MRPARDTIDFKILLKLVPALFLLALGAACAAPAGADEKQKAPVAVLNSKVNAGTYQYQHLGTYENDYFEFKRTLGAANIQFDEIYDGDLAAGKARLGAYKLVVVPLLVDMPADAVNGLTEYYRGGGRVLITDGGGQLQPGAASVASLAGVSPSESVTFKEPARLAWTDSPIPIKEDFAVGTTVARLKITDGCKTLARWESQETAAAGAAIVRKNNVAYFGWVPGLQGEITANARFMSMVLDDLSPGITQEAAVKISFAEYQSIKDELDYLKKRTEEAISTAKQAEFAVPMGVIQSNFDQAIKHIEQFHEAYHARRFAEADNHLEKARSLLAIAFGQSMPVRPVEARSVWLDRGTIVACRNAQGMKALFDKLQRAGINVVYFETNNAGFVMYPGSKFTEQNPETLAWDPMGTAVSEAKKRGMEIHAWLWIFNVGNTRHNPIINKEPDYPGPVLNRYGFDLAMAARNGALVPPRQSEFWLDPSNKNARQYIKNLITEVITRFPVDGIQLDYIRYPFNNKGSEMGFNWLSRVKFEQETGLSLDKLDDETREVFIAWKIQQVNEFVREASELVRSTRPGLRISAAVYAFPPRMRRNAIQQDWETWVANGWIDTLNPMTYAEDAKSLAVMADFCREATADKALVYPGLAIRRFDAAGLIEQIDQARVNGTLGTTIFAVAHLDDKRMDILRVGPYRRKTLLTPQSQPIRASRFLVDDFAAMVNRYLQDPRTHILSDTASTNDVIVQIEAIQKAMHELHPDSSPEQLEAARNEITHLHDTVKEWLRLEAFIQRGFRAQYIVNYLSQVEAILAYASHRASVEANPERPNLAGANM
ncbi:MAG: family 10 glycosylhydrolase [Candidatus Obscuribacterales bacterium]